MSPDRDRPPLPGAGQPAPNYTSAFLVSFGRLLFMPLFALRAAWGRVTLRLAAYAGDRFLRRLRR
jgi:hypothetical protein